MNNKNTKSLITNFWVNEKPYMIDLFCSDDDRTEVSDKEGNVIATFTSDCYVFLRKKDTTILGRTTMRGNLWFFVQNEDVKGTFGEGNGFRDIYQLEVAIATAIIKGELTV